MLWCVIGLFVAGVECPNLERPRFGRVVMTGISFGSTATYSCQIGYRLVGEPTRTCQANGQWSGVAPVCKSEWQGKICDSRNNQHLVCSRLIQEFVHFIAKILTFMIIYCQIFIFVAVIFGAQYIATI